MLLAALIAVAWIATVVAVLAVGFRWGKQASYFETLRGDLARRGRIARTYVQATVAVLIPAYGRRWDRQRAQALQAYRDNLQPIERSFPLP